MGKQILLCWIKQILHLLNEIFGSQPNTDFKYERSYKDNNGFTHHVYQQYHLGLKVYGASIGLHERKNNIEYINANYASIHLNEIAPKFQTKEILLKANETALATTNTYGKQLTEAKASEAEMVFAKNNFGDFVLTYKVKVNAKEQLVYFYMDATSGELLYKEFSICNTNAPGTGQTIYSGNRSFIGDQQGSQFRLRQVRNGVNIITWNNNFSTDKTGAAATDFWDNDNNWTAGEHPNDMAALDVHWATQNIFDYWFTVHNRNSIDNIGMAINSFVHVGNNNNDAHWDPNIGFRSMYYGDGDGTQFRAFTALDICAHELGHGICQFTSDLIYNTQESGALNEGFSDIWGATIENWTDPAKQTWLIGEEMTIVTPGFIRSMSNPNQAPFNWQQPDTYLGTNWGSLGSDPYINSGVLNFWYYVLCQGGNGTNDIGNAYSVNGIGIADAARIAYATEQNLLSGDGYPQTRTMSIQQARRIFGAGSCQEIAVTKAWFAVGVGANYPAPPVVNAIIEGLNSFCTSSTYTITGSPAGYTTTWSTSNPSIATVPANSTGTSVVVNRISNGNFFLIASYTSTSVPCSTYIQPTTKSITAGAYSNYQVQVSGPYMVPLNYVASYSVDQNTYSGLTNLVWSWPTGWSYITGGNGSGYIVLRSPSSSSTGNINLSFTSCGVSGILATKWVAWGYGGPTYRVSPNPANDILRIEQIDSATNKALAQTDIQRIEIIDKMGLVAYKKAFAKGTPNSMTIQVGHLRNDIYTVRIFDGKEWKLQKIIIQH